MKSKLTYVILITTTLSIMASTAQGFINSIFLEADSELGYNAVFVFTNNNILKEPPWSIYYKLCTDKEYSLVMCMGSDDKNTETFVLMRGACTKLEVELEPDFINCEILVYKMLSATNYERKAKVKINPMKRAGENFKLHIKATNEGIQIKSTIVPKSVVAVEELEGFTNLRCPAHTSTPSASTPEP